MVANYGKQIDPGAAQSVTGDTLLNITRCSTYFGLADLGFGCPELGYFSRSELARVRLPFGLGIERDIGFASDFPLSRWAHAARVTGSILRAEAILRRENPAPDPELSSDPTDG